MTTVGERIDTPQGRPLVFWTIVAGSSYAGLCLLVHVLLHLPAVMALGALPVVAAGVAADLARLRNEEHAGEALRALAWRSFGSPCLPMVSHAVHMHAGRLTTPLQRRTA